VVGYGDGHPYDGNDGRGGYIPPDADRAIRSGTGGLY